MTSSWENNITERFGGIHWLHIKTSNIEIVSVVMISLCIGACHWRFQFQDHEQVVKRNEDEIVQEARDGRRQSARRLLKDAGRPPVITPYGG